VDELTARLDALYDTNIREFRNVVEANWPVLRGRLVLLDEATDLLQRVMDTNGEYDIPWNDVAALLVRLREAQE
jgi:hypothetical protein